MKTLILLLSFLAFSIGTIAAQQANPVDNSGNVYFQTAVATNSAQLTVWPNPANDHINIFVNTLPQEEKAQLVMYNISGVQLLVRTVGYGNNTIYLNNIPAGIYFIRLVRENGVIITSKLIVAR